MYESLLTICSCKDGVLMPKLQLIRKKNKENIWYLSTNFGVCCFPVKGLNLWGGS